MEQMLILERVKARPAQCPSEGEETGSTCRLRRPRIRELRSEGLTLRQIASPVPSVQGNRDEYRSLIAALLVNCHVRDCRRVTGKKVCRADFRALDFRS